MAKNLPETTRSESILKAVLKTRRFIVAVFIGLAIASIFLLNGLKFSFDFKQFFPKDDPDLIFYNAFTAEFGQDDSFLMIAIENEGSVFENDFLERFHQFTLKAKKLPYVTESQSLTTLFYPIKTSFGYARLPMIHLGDSSQYGKDWQKIQNDSLFTNTLIDTKASSMIVVLKTQDELDYSQSVTLLAALRKSLREHRLPTYHILGRVFFYEAIVKMQKRELGVVSIISTILVLGLLFIVYRRPTIVMIIMVSIALSLLLFMGILSLLGRELNALSAFYPILILVVGTSDIIHIVDNYLFKLRQGFPKEAAIIATLREVGLTTFMTSATTAIGFMSLMTSKLSSIQDFGINSAVGVFMAYFTALFFTTSLLILVSPKYVVYSRIQTTKWTQYLSKINGITRHYPKIILLASLLFMLICFWGVSKITTDFRFNENLPKGDKITSDFLYFQKNYAGFRPLEIAILAKEGHKVTDYNLLQDIDHIEQRLKSIKAIGNVRSAALLYKWLNKAFHLGRQEFFVLPNGKSKFESLQKEAHKLARKQFNNFVNKDASKGRITMQVLDVGTDSLTKINSEITTFLATQTDTSLATFRLTGKGLLLDKNSIYIRDSLLQGLALALLLISLIMTMLFRDWKILLVALIPNVLPLLFAGAILGFLGIPLEASIAVVFVIIFGISVDDSIHFLGKYKICKKIGLGDEAAIEKTFKETGKALIITTLLLIFGFMVLLFSVQRPTVVIGLLISITLLTALIMDLFLLPVLLRKLTASKKGGPKIEATENLIEESQ